MKQPWTQGLCLALVSAQFASAALAAPTAVWPEPSQPQPRPQRVSVLPNFQAPSATQCERGIETRDLPDGQPRPLPQPHRERRASGADGGAIFRADKAVPGSAALTPPPAYAPAPALAAEAASGRMVPPAKGAADMASPPPPAPITRAPQPGQPPQSEGANLQAQATAVVTAGVVDDNANFSEYLAFRNRTPFAQRVRDVRERHLLEVHDAQGRPVPDAEVVVQSAAGYAMWARTDAGGTAWIHPNAFDPAHAGFYDVTVRRGQQQTSAVLRRGQKSSVEVVLNGQAQPSRARLDLVFLIDATGSMGDEIDKLKSSLRGIVDEVSRLPSRPDLCLGLVAYRDRGDEFFVRSHDLTNDLGAFQGVLNALQAGGGGDYPEAMSEAFSETVHRINWRGDQATRLVVLLADAPPHLDYGGPQYDDDMLAALGKGIKVLSVGASGLDKQGEVIQRQIAQYTGGRFVFLTYDQATNPASGPGRETVHDVRNYSVQTLDKLIVRLVREELARLPKG